MIKIAMCRLSIAIELIIFLIAIHISAARGHIRQN